MLSGKRIILGVTGGIAAFKAAILLRAYQKAGAEVRVIMTPAATRFVGVETFASLSKHEVAIEIFPEDSPNTTSWTRHIDWAKWADLFVIAPCTANSLSKIANGISNNMLTATVLAARCPLLICPTMDGEMYQSPAVRQNLEQVNSFGYHILEPDKGYLASGLKGRGRLPEIERIVEKSEAILANEKGPLSGKNVVVTAGPTREYIDPVRFISNPSSGKMGFAMARAAQRLGAVVSLLHGPVSLKIPEGIHSQSFDTTKELSALVNEHSRADIIIMAAAVSDFTPKKRVKNKIKKKSGLTEILLQRTTDILQQLGKEKPKGQIIIGFAMETENLIENAKEKRVTKNMDWIIANSLSEQDTGFAVDTNTVWLIGEEGKKEFSGTKDEVAKDVLSYIFK